MTQLKILLGNNTLSLLAGSETWTYTLALQLKKLEHKVEGFSPELGIIADELKKEGIVCHNNISTSGVKPFSFVLEEKHDFDYDVIIANHNHIVDYLRSQYPTKPIIATIHGILHTDDKGNIFPEYPALNSGVNQFVAVSEEVQEKLRNDYAIDSVIIRNFIDLNRYKTKKKISKGKPKQIFFNSNYNLSNDPEVQILREVTNHYGAKLAATGQNFSQSFDLRKAIEDSDIVVGMGRSVLEGMAMGRVGIVHGRWGTAGIVRASNIDEIKYCNFSGRNSGGNLMTAEEMIKEIDEFYNENTADWSKKYIALNHNAVLAADEYVSIARDLLGQNINPPIKKLKYAKSS